MTRASMIIKSSESKPALATHTVVLFREHQIAQLKVPGSCYRSHVLHLPSPRRALGATQQHLLFRPARRLQTLLLPT